MAWLTPVQLKRREREKYERMWAISQYRENDQAVGQAARFCEWVPIPKGSTIVDLGCGHGYASRFFFERGMRVIAVDIADSSIEAGNRALVEFICGTMWDLPRSIITDYGFCVDVMEHIPPARVGATLSAIKRSVRREVFFDISLRKDGYGKLIGETLHLTVRPVEWWQEQLARHWSYVTVISVDVIDQSAEIVVGSTSELRARDYVSVRAGRAKDGIDDH
jgi:SAM-dependent methyltransferase